MKKKPIILFVYIFLGFFIPLQSQSNQQERNHGSGKLFIIGGGDKTNALMNEMIQAAGLKKNDYIVVLPMAGENPDSSIIWAKEDFGALGLQNVFGFNFKENQTIAISRIDSLRNARLIYISGGDQSRFMKIVQKGPIYKAIHDAYKNGSTIAGTSAGAAVMSKKMITGNSLKYPDYTGIYPSIETANIELTEGLGLLQNIIVDQHFIKRQRLNRLIAVAIENPDEMCVGIDESTAILVQGKSFKVCGENQVIIIRNKEKSKIIQNQLLGAKNLILDILLPGETINIK